jgi:hypothetical protein
MRDLNCELQELIHKVSTAQHKHNLFVSAGDQSLIDKAIEYAEKVTLAQSIKNEIQKEIKSNTYADVTTDPYVQLLKASLGLMEAAENERNHAQCLKIESEFDFSGRIGIRYSSSSAEAAFDVSRSRINNALAALEAFYTNSTPSE